MHLELQQSTEADGFKAQKVTVENAHYEEKKW
jgi:hypothetical protein